MNKLDIKKIIESYNKKISGFNSDKNDDFIFDDFEKAKVFLLKRNNHPYHIYGLMIKFGKEEEQKAIFDFLIERAYIEKDILINNGKSIEDIDDSIISIFYSLFNYNYSHRGKFNIELIFSENTNIYNLDFFKKLILDFGSYKRIRFSIYSGIIAIGKLLDGNKNKEVVDFIYERLIIEDKSKNFFEVWNFIRELGYLFRNYPEKIISLMNLRKNYIEHGIIALGYTEKNKNLTIGIITEILGKYDYRVSNSFGKNQIIFRSIDALLRIGTDKGLIYAENYVLYPNTEIQYVSLEYLGVIGKEKYENIYIEAFKKLKISKDMAIHNICNYGTIKSVPIFLEYFSKNIKSMYLCQAIYFLNKFIETEYKNEIKKLFDKIIKKSDSIEIDFKEVSEKIPYFYNKT